MPASVLGEEKVVAGLVKTRSRRGLIQRESLGQEGFPCLREALGLSVGDLITVQVYRLMWRCMLFAMLRRHVS